MQLKNIDFITSDGTTMHGLPNILTDEALLATEEDTTDVIRNCEATKSKNPRDLPLNTPKDLPLNNPRDWSSSFQRLLSIFAQINTHLIFLSTHSRTTIPTFQLIKKLNNEITELDLAIIKKLSPHGEILFEYVDENEIMLYFTEKVKFDWNKGYELSKTNMQNAYDDFNSEKSLSKLLVFDFKDTKMHGIGGAIKGKRRKVITVKKSAGGKDAGAENSIIDNKNGTPTYTDNVTLAVIAVGKSPSPESERDFNGFFEAKKDFNIQPMNQLQLTRMIRSRNEKFIRRILDHLRKFTPEEVALDEPMRRLLEDVEIPKLAVILDPVELLNSKTTLKSESIEKPSTDSMIEVIQSKPFYKDQIIDIRTFTPAQTATNAPLPELSIHPDLKDAFYRYKGISLDTDLYSHQTEALTELLSQTKKHIIISTSTSSGKSLIFQIPILNEILWDIESGQRNSTAIFIFPTKALAQDQKRHLQELIHCLPVNETRKINIDTYDGDTPAKDRAYIRTHTDIIFTNPDTIHASILPHHDGFENLESTGWKSFLLKLKYVIMDELHVYKGTFGINVALIMSRLNRICQVVNYNESVQYIACSATILNAESHFRTICSVPLNEIIVHISRDGSPCSERKLIIWNPPALMNKRGYIEEKHSNSSAFTPRESIVPELAKLFIHLLSNFPSIKVIIFCPIRVVCEHVIKEARKLIKDQIASGNSTLHDGDVMSYRGGYSKSDRRTIELKMFTGQLRGIVATNALELGIDLADLDVVITCGFPALKLNLHQQFGRAGRGKSSKGSLAIFVGGSTPIDQHYLNNVDLICDKGDYEDLCVDGLLESGAHESIFEDHLQCAAYEYKISIVDDLQWFIPNGSKHLTRLFKTIVSGCLRQDIDGKYVTDSKYLPRPSEHVSVRSVEEIKFAVVDTTNNRNTVIEEVEELRTSFTLYEGGIFLHQGMPYLVKEFNIESKFAKVERVRVDWVTSQRDFTDIDPAEIERIKQLHPMGSDKPIDVPAYYGKIDKTTIVFGFFKVNRRNEIMEAVEVYNEPVIMHSKGFWIDIPIKSLEVIKEKCLSPAGGIHAAQHSIMNMLSVCINLDRRNKLSRLGESELVTECKAPEKEFARRQSKRLRPYRLVFHDSNGGAKGSGISAKAFDHIDQILHACYNRIRECDCQWGCPNCVTGSFCKEMSLVMSKPAALVIFATLIGLDVDVVKHEIRDGPEENMPGLNVETIQACSMVTKISPNVEFTKREKRSTY